MKRIIFAAVSLCVVVVEAGEVARKGEVSDAELSRLVAEDLQHPVRPAGVNGQAVWNSNAIWFMYPPVLKFSDRTDVHYRVRIFDTKGNERYFVSKTPYISFAKVWGKIPDGKVEVWVEMTQPNHIHCLHRYFRTFWKMAPFKPGAYARPERSYADAARLGYEYIFNLPHLKKFLETGKPDGSYKLNCYPSKMHSSVINGMVAYAAAVPSEAERAIKLARVMADYLISISEPAGAPLAYFTPTYEGTELTAREFGGQTMLAYPASAASAFIRLYTVAKDDKYLAAARNIAETYLKLQGEDGTWPLKLYVKDAKPVNVNRLHPVNVIDMLDELYDLTGDDRYSAAAERAFAYFENGPMKSWDWEGQFEDVRPKAPYENLTKHTACWVAMRLVRRWPGDKKRLAAARELLRFSEDQFVGWAEPFAKERISIVDSLRRYPGWSMVPAVVEQYNYRDPIDSSAAKLIFTYLALYKASGNPLDLAKARALGDACVKMQEKDGRIPTAWRKGYKRGNDWLNCMLATFNALKNLAEFE